MAYVILAALLVVAVALAVRPFLVPSAPGAESVERENWSEAYREDVRQDFLMGKIAPEEFEKALQEEGGE